VRRITKVALGGVAGCALILGGTQAAGGALLELLQVREPAELFTATGPLDDAKGKITIGEAENGATVFRLRVTGIDSSLEGKPLGSHLHTGPCLEDDFGDPSASPSPIAPGPQAGPHYNHQVAVGGKKLPHPDVDPALWAEVSPKTEVWFDLVPDAEGIASDKAKVSFVPVDSDGKMSVVVHVGPTIRNPDLGTVGSAGARQACFPLSVAGVFPATVPPPPSE
jgi:Cu/Zn superoxide dismutase